MPGADRASLLALAAQRLRDGAVVAFPTETVYGLGADALNPIAIQRVFQLKGRPAHNPLIVHVADITMARAVVAQWTPQAQRLADAFWPGPLTIVLPKAPGIPDIVTAGGPTVGVRQPAHPLALDLLRAFGAPLVGPSANPSGTISPTTAAHVRSAFGERDVMVLDGGACSRGIESTVVSLAESTPRVLRRGFVAPEEIERVLGVPIAVGGAVESSGALPSPGMLARHYAPSTPAALFEPGQWPAILSDHPAPIVVLTHDHHKAAAPPHHIIHLPPDDHGYAAALYNSLRLADQRAAAHILIERPREPGPLWDAIRDRLARATTSQ